MTNIEILADGTLKVTWNGKKGRGSLFQIAAEGNAANANRLNMSQLLAVIACVQVCPFPLGKGEEVYRQVLADIEAGKQAKMLENAQSLGIGKVREFIVREAGSGFNAPYDSYLTIAAG